MDNLVWSTEKRLIKELIPLEKNPFGKVKKDGRKRLQEKIKKLGIFEIPTIDFENTLLTFNKRHYALMTLGRGEEEIDVRIPNRLLTDIERKEIILASNVHEGEWEKDILLADYADIDNDFMGMDDDFFKVDIPETEDETEAEFPIVQKFSEKYDAVVIIVDNEIDRNCLFTMLGLNTEKCYKTQRTGVSQVISFKQFLDYTNKA